MNIDFFSDVAPNPRGAVIKESGRRPETEYPPQPRLPHESHHGIWFKKDWSSSCSDFLQYFW